MLPTIYAFPSPFPLKSGLGMRLALANGTPASVMMQAEAYTLQLALLLPQDHHTMK